jgi:transaldolase
MMTMVTAAEMVKKNPKVELLWASTRELLNVIQADKCGCDIITVTNDILKKLPNVGKDLNRLSLETVEMFYRDAQDAGYDL